MPPDTFICLSRDTDFTDIPNEELSTIVRLQEEEAMNADDWITLTEFSNECKEEILTFINERSR